MELVKFFWLRCAQKRACTLDESPCGKLSTGFCLILIKLFALAVHRSSRERLEKTRQASLLLGLATVLACIFWLVGCLFFQLFGKEGLLVFCRQLILDQLIRDELARKLLFVMYQVEYLAKLFDFYTKCRSFCLTLHDQNSSLS